MIIALITFFAIFRLRHAFAFAAMLLTLPPLPLSRRRCRLLSPIFRHFADTPPHTYATLIFRY
jgi:hypothetical protein